MSLTFEDREIPPLSLRGLLNHIGKFQVMEPDTEELMRELNEREWHGEDIARGHHWHTSFHACLTGDTEVVTRQGIKPIRELAAVGEAELLLPIQNLRDGQSREGRGQRKKAYRTGGFDTAPVRSWGEHEIYEVSLRRGRQVKIVQATAQHRWYLKDTSVKTTLDLYPGLKLKGVRARRGGGIRMMPFAIAQGFVFGDGTARRYRRDAAWLDIHHNGKDEAILPFFAGHTIREFQREGRMRVSQIQALPRLWKQLPSFEESTSFLLSWLSGYFAADGSVSKSGQATICSASREAIDFVRGVLAICGISYGHVNVDVQSGVYPHGQRYEGKIMYSVNLNIRHLPPWFFVISEHKQRAEERNKKPVGHAQEWEVVAINSTGHVEEVFCPTTAAGCFALSDELLTGNSEFPGDSPIACTRYLAYRMMGFANTEPMPPWVTTTGDVGKAGEMSLARAWYEGRRLLAKPEDMLGGEQLVFSMPDHWLTGSVDLPILKKGWHKPHIVEVKGKADEVIEAMQKGIRRWDEGHRLQVLTSLALAHQHDWGTVEICQESWRLSTISGGNPFLAPNENPFLPYCPEHGRECLVELQLEPPDSASLYYWSRSWPRKTVEYFFEYDADFMEQGLAVLDEAREHFLAGTIPPRDETFKWTLQPCKWCNLKKLCKQDVGTKKKPGPTKLNDSHLVAHTQALRDYDPEESRQLVIERWSDG